MRLPPAAALLAVLLTPVLMGAGGSLARTARPPDDSIERWVSDLLGDDRSDRTYAARLLRSRVRVAVKRADRAAPESLDHGDALATLDTFDTVVAPACVQALDRPGATGPCADLLGLLATATALPRIDDLLARSGDDAPGRCARHRLERARARIAEGASPGVAP